MSFLDAAKLAAGQKLGKTLLLANKYSPQILTAVGVVGVVAAVGLTIRSTLKLNETLEKTEKDLFVVKNSRDELTEKQYRKELTRVYLHRTGDLVKLYGPPLGALVIGTTAFLGANNILSRRNVALAAAYNVVKAEYDQFRANVRDELGEDRERELRLGLRDEKVTDIETGKEITVKKGDPSRYSRYAKIFDEGNENFNKHSREANLTFLLGQQSYATQRLQRRGWLTLNEVYEALGLPQTPDGAVVGWVSDGADGYVDFGIFDLDSPAARDFVNGYERSIVLDFNVDGLIQDRIGWK